jgi:hypothetical protein
MLRMRLRAALWGGVIGHRRCDLFDPDRTILPLRPPGARRQPASSVLTGDSRHVMLPARAA